MSLQDLWQKLQRQEAMAADIVAKMSNNPPSHPRQEKWGEELTGLEKRAMPLVRHELVKKLNGD